MGDLYHCAMAHEVGGPQAAAHLQEVGAPLNAETCLAGVADTYNRLPVMTQRTVRKRLPRWTVRTTTSTRLSTTSVSSRPTVTGAGRGAHDAAPRWRLAGQYRSLRLRGLKS